MSSFSHIITQIDRLVWNPLAISLVLGAGIFFTLRLALVQIKGFRQALSFVTKRGQPTDDPGSISHYRTFMVALSSTLGMGGITGVALAIIMGGPGAVFWMMVTSFLVMALQFASATLATHFRTVNDKGDYFAGPMYFIELGLGVKFRWLAMCFAFFTVLASVGVGCLFQINNITTTVSTYFSSVSGVGKDALNLFLGIGVASFSAVIILNGTKGLGRFAKYIFPVFCVAYLIVGLFVLLKNFSAVPSAFWLIISNAFHAPHALAGGVLGTAIRSGLSRGMLASTAGMGAESIILGTARTQDPVTQGLVAMLVPFVDIFIFGLITALVIITTGAYDTSVLHPNLVGQALSLGLGSNIGLHLANSTNIFFAFCAIVCWSYYGDRAVSYLFGKQGVFTFRYVYLFFIIFGAVMIVESTLTMCHVFYGLMALPYLVSVLALSPVVVRLTKQHFRKTGF